MGSRTIIAKLLQTPKMIAKAHGKPLWSVLYGNTVQPDGQRQRLTEKCGYWGLHSRSVGARVLEREGSGKQSANSLEQVRRCYLTVLPESDGWLRRGNARTGRGMLCLFAQESPQG